MVDRTESGKFVGDEDDGGFSVSLLTSKTKSHAPLFAHSIFQLGRVNHLALQTF